MDNQLFDHLVPVSFPAGHMGTFLKGFLSPTVDNLFYDSTKKIENHEWEFNDIFDSLFGNDVKTFNPLISILAEFYQGTDIFKVAAIVIINTKYYLKTNKIKNCHTKFHTPLLLKMARDKSNHKLNVPLELIKTRTSRYLKEHQLTLRFDKAVLTTRDMEWKRKINCIFPVSKYWIPYYLLKYKSSMSTYLKYHLHHLNLIPDSNPFIASMQLSEVHYTDPTQFNFNIYELVFNKNLTQVYEVDPAFEYTKEKQDMLELAHLTSHEILNSFDLNVNHIIDETTSIKDVLSLQTKL